MLQKDQPLNATGSSMAVPDLRASGLAAVDGNRHTTWTPLLTDIRPKLALNWLGERRIDRIRAKLASLAPAQRPTELLLVWPGGERRVELDDQGRGEFPEIRTDQLTVRVTKADGAVSVDHDGSVSRLPVGISELRLHGVPFEPLRLSPDQRTWPCGTGPTIGINGVPRPTKLVASPAELYRGDKVRAIACVPAGRVTLREAENSVRATSSDVAVPDTLDLRRQSETVGPTEAAVGVDRISPVEQSITPPAGSRIVTLRQNVNAGWTAEQGGTRLDSLVVDGWQQGWVTDGSSEEVHARFGPDTPYRWGLAGGGALLALLVVLGLLPARRWGRTDAQALDARTIPAWVMVPASVAIAGVLAGWVGAAIGVCGVLLGTASRSWWGDAGSWLLALSALVASFGYFLRPWTDPAGWAGEWAWPAYAVALVLSAGLVVACPPGGQFRHRMDGLSTKRYRSSAATSDRTSVSAHIWRKWPRNSS
jgi:arabinofuranan 3-O-arabinosyltransferase